MSAEPAAPWTPQIRIVASPNRRRTVSPGAADGRAAGGPGAGAEPALLRRPAALVEHRVRGPVQPLGIVHVRGGGDPDLDAGGRPARVGAGLPAGPRAGPPGGPAPRPAILGAGQRVPIHGTRPRLPDGPGPPGRPSGFGDAGGLTSA